MALSADQERRARRAASNWSRDNAFWVFGKFDKDDAYQEARMALLSEPDLSIRGLHHRIIDAVRALVPGYRQRKILELPEAYSSREAIAHQENNPACMDGPVQWTHAQESIRYIQADPDREELAELTLAGTPGIDLAARYGLSAGRIAQMQRRLVEELLGTQPRR